jgi:hypothetical protein
MGRGEYSSIGSNGDSALRQVEAHYTPTQRHFRELFANRVGELDTAIQQADRDFATTYNMSWRYGGHPPPPSPLPVDQSRFVLSYWQPFVRAWNAARPMLLAGKIDPAAALILMSWASRYNDLKMDAGGSWGLDTTAPSVTIL